MDIKTLSAYEKNKPAIYKWRDLNKEKYNDIIRLLNTNITNSKQNLLSFFISIYFF